MKRLATLHTTTQTYHLRLALLTFVAYSLGTWFIIQNQIPPLSDAETTNIDSVTTRHKAMSFPVSIDPKNKTITDDPRLYEFISSELASNHTPSRRTQSLFAIATEIFFTHHWYQQLASPISRTIVIYSGQRTEEVSANFAKILRWTTAEREQFHTLVSALPPHFLDGTLYPGRYVVERESSPETVAEQILTAFNAAVSTRYTSEIEAIIPLTDTLIIASLIEREAYDFADMRIISGIIWNRLFINMPLQIDASLQYIRGSEPSEKWWPVPRPADKFLNSPFNTYQNKGLPPAPIANPSIDAIVAALNPIATDCLFYFHTNDGTFYCTETYEEHVTLLKEKF
jgi:hypothetical protein